MYSLRLLSSLVFCYLLYGCSSNPGSDSGFQNQDSTDVNELFIADTLLDHSDTIEIIEPENKSTSRKVTDYGIVVQETSSIISFMQNLNNYKLEYQIETSVTIMMEGPHCDLIDWEHGYTGWIDYTNFVEPKSCYFEWPETPDSINNLFPEIQIDDLKNKVREHCGEVWYKSIVNIKSPFEYPSGVGVSRFLFRVSGIRNDNGVKTSRIFSIKMAMGC